MKLLLGCRERSGIGTFVLAVLLLVCCGGCTKKVAFPNRDIIFDTGEGGSKIKFGLVDADGSGLEYIEFRQPTARYSNFPVWSPDRTKIVYSMSFGMEGFSGDIVVIDLQRAKVKQICSPNKIHQETTKDRIRWTPNGTQLIATIFGRGIEILDPQTCESERVLVSYPPEADIRSPDLSVLNELVYNEISVQERQQDHKRINCGYVIVKNLNTNEMRNLGIGMYPSWSPDGEWIAFAREDGLYIMRKDGSEKRKMVELVPWWNAERASLDPPRPVWSPDGKWLVYHKYDKIQGRYRPGIYKLDMNTGQETKLGEFVGLNPHWHWNPKIVVVSRPQ